MRETDDGNKRGIPSKNIITAAKGGGISFLGKIAANIIGLFFVLVMARLLGTQDYGVYKLMIILISVLSGIAALGLSSGLKRFIAIANNEGDDSSIWAYIQVGIGIPSVLGISFAFIVYLTAELIAVEIFNEPRLIEILKIGSLAIPVFVLLHIFSGIAIGFKKIEYQTYTQEILFNLLKLILSIVAVSLGFGLFGVTLAYVISSLVALVLLIHLVTKLFSFKRPLNSASNNTREFIKYSIPLLFSLILNKFSRRLETIALGIFNISATVGIYSVILTISQVGNLGFTAIRDISSPIFAELHNKKHQEELKSLYQATNKWSLSLNIPIFLTILVFGENILSAFGKDFEAGSKGMIILAAGVLLNSATGTCGALLNMAGYSRISFYNSIVFIIITIILDLLLIPDFGLVGAALAGGLTLVIVNILRMLEVYFLINHLLPFNLSFFKTNNCRYCSRLSGILD